MIRKRGRVVFSDPAKADLLGIYLYIAEDNRTAARRYIKRLQKSCSVLAQTPFLGRQRPDVLEDVRSHPVESHVILYRVIPRGVEIVRVFHGAQDIMEAKIEK